MGKADRNRQQSARAKIAAQQASAERAEQRRKVLIAVGGAAVVLVLVVVLVVIKLAGGSSGKTLGAGTTTASATVATSVSRDIATVPSAALDKVAAGPAHPPPGRGFPNPRQALQPPGPAPARHAKPQGGYDRAADRPRRPAHR